MYNRFTWKEDDLKIEDPVGSGLFIPLREFNRRIAAEQAREAAENILPEEDAGKEKQEEHIK